MKGEVSGSWGGSPVLSGDLTDYLTSLATLLKGEPCLPTLPPNLEDLMPKVITNEGNLHPTIMPGSYALNQKK